MSRTVLITGCSSGIGRALADAFYGAGYRVFATARRNEDLAELAAAGFDVCALDVTDDDAITQLAERLTAEAGGLDVLINNAGFGAMGPALDFDRDTLRAQFETNVFAPLMLARACLPLLRKRRGVIVNLGSVAGLMASPFGGVYCASKAALHRLSEAMRMELAPFGVDVIVVQPGAVATRFGQSARAGLGTRLHDDSPWRAWRERIEQRANSSNAFSSTPASAMAHTVLNAVEQTPRRRVVKVGRGGQLIPLLERLLPMALREALLKRHFGLRR
ncbi:SDR family oxidoreductase [Phytohalomonas tamaricis]|uniref:SDR family oxidoreductase n=1 Tax=Phytohalomonas tamaricis TaxID=2081032 RepID=UPI000D0B2BE6|nr:SDR family oxidoreductase [Phytohalomonas tamaricis]